MLDWMHVYCCCGFDLFSLLAGCCGVLAGPEDAVRISPIYKSGSVIATVDHSTDRNLEPDSGIPILERPFHLLGFFSPERPSWTLSALARESGLPKASCLRSIRVLEKYRFLRREGDEYRLGSQFIRLGAFVQESSPSRAIALPYLERLRNTTGHTSQWAVLDGSEGVYTEVVQAQAGLRLYIVPGQRVQLYCGASARLLLAFAPNSVREHTFLAPHQRYTHTTPTSLEELKTLDTLTQKTWMAASFGEVVEHSVELAAPVFGANGHFLAAISIGAASTAYPSEQDIKRDLHLLNDTARELSHDLGYSQAWLGDPDFFLTMLKGMQLLPL